LWHKVVTVEGPKGRLIVQTAPPVKIMERYGMKNCHKISEDSLSSASKSTKRIVDKSAFVLDMGQNLSGFPEITVCGKKGQKVTMYVSERLKPQGVCDQSQTGRPYYYEYILNGNISETWHPRFSYYGFRYIQVEGAVLEGMDNPDSLPVIKCIESCFVYNSAPEVSFFECSNTIFTRTHRLIERAERSNMQGVFTDCPHREKLGWLEQDHLCGPSLLYNYDITSFVPKILHDIADAQKTNGMVPTVAPQYVSFGNLFDDSPEWGSTAIILPFMYYDQYGDSSLIQKCYPMMIRYVDYLSSRAKDHIIDFGLGDWYDYGPWVAGFSKNTSVALVATSYYIYDLQLVNRAASMMGDNASKLRFSSLLDSVILAFNNRFYKSDSGFYDTGSQTANALPLYLEITGSNKEKIVSSLIADIHAHGDRLTTGDVGNRYLFQSLVQNGYSELLYKMFNHYDAPGYGFQLHFDATTLTEQWDPRKGSSWNHFMMGQIDEWLFCSLGGIRNYPGTHGLRHLMISPSLVGDLTYVKAKTRSLYGDIFVSLTKTSLTVEIPVGCYATIVLPNGKTQTVGSGKYNINYK
jgi:alpha-L-rhamnosidase